MYQDALHVASIHFSNRKVTFADRSLGASDVQANFIVPALKFPLFELQLLVIPGLRHKSVLQTVK